MITLWQSVLIGLVVVATQLDGQVLGECKLREPIVTGFLVGLILGDVTKGLIIGSQMQLMWMGATAIGPTAGLDVGTGGTIGVAVAIALIIFQVRSGQGSAPAAKPAIAADAASSIASDDEWED